MGDPCGAAVIAVLRNTDNARRQRARTSHRVAGNDNPLDRVTDHHTGGVCRQPREVDRVVPDVDPVATPSASLNTGRRSNQGIATHRVSNWTAACSKKQKGHKCL